MHAVKADDQPPRPPSRGLPRRAVLAAAGLAAPFLPRLGRAAELNWRIAHNAPADFPLHLRLVEAAKAITHATNGTMAVEVHPNSELGNPMGLLRQLRAGTIDMVPLTSQILARDLPVAALPMAGFAFTSTEQLWSALDGDVGGYVRSRLKAQLDLVAMERCWDFGFRQITTSGKVIKSAADIVGLRLRTQPDADLLNLFETLKAVPVEMPVTVLKDALAGHDVDAQENVLFLFSAANLYKVQSTCALTNHAWDGEWICASGKSWSGLPSTLQHTIGLAMNASGLRQRQDMADATVSIRTDMKAAGITVNTVDTQSFRTVLRQSGYYTAWRKTIGDDGWDALEKYTGPLAP